MTLSNHKSFAGVTGLALKLTLVALTIGLAAPAFAQQVLLDKSVSAGELTLFPVYKDEKSFYYLPNKPRLALDASGQPQFSFIRFVRNEETGASDSSTSRTDEGGGIVTALVELGVSDEQLDEAKSALRSQVPGAVIKGALPYRSGKFSLNSVFANPNGERTEQVLGIGSAPLMEGSKAAISLDLTNKGAQELWASFDMPTPNITFHFEMQFEGLRSPQQVTIEADYEKIYNHHSFNVGAAGNLGKVVFGSEIDAAFSDLRRSEAIRINSVNPDADMNDLIKTTNKYLTDAIFRPLNNNNQKLPGIEAATGAAAGQGFLDKATTLLKDARAAVGPPKPSGKSDNSADLECEEEEEKITGSHAPEVSESSEKAKTLTEAAEVNPATVEGSKKEPKSEKSESSPVKPVIKKPESSSDIFSLDSDIDFSKSHIEFIKSGGTYDDSPERRAESKELYESLDALYKSGEVAKSIVGWHRLMDLKPYSGALYNLGQAYRNYGDLAAARVFYLLFLDMTEAEGKTEKQAESVAFAKGYLEELPTFNPGLEPSDSSHYKRLIGGDFTEVHIKALDIEAGFDGSAVHPDARAVFLRANGHYEAGNYTEAGREYRNSYDLFASPLQLYNMAKCYFELELIAEALQHFKIYQVLAQNLSVTEKDDATKKEWAKNAKDVQAIIDKLTAELAEDGAGTEPGESSKEVVGAPIGDLVKEAGSSALKAGGAPGQTKSKPLEPVTGEEATKSAVADAKSEPESKAKSCKPKKSKTSEAKDERPVLSVVARYQFRRQKQSGTFRLNMNKYTSGTRNDNFAENIGDLSRLKGDKRFFNEVNLDEDMAYDQREIVVMLNGLNSADFDDYINFASVKLRKRHESGAQTIDDIRIDKNNIDRTNKKFILLYGNKGDQNRDRWLDYEFQTSWNFAGGHVEGDETFRVSNGEAIALTPPIERLNLQVEADPTVLAAQNVRAVDVKVFWTIGNKTDSEQVLLRLPDTSASISMLAPVNAFGYEYEVTWMRSGGLPDVRSGRQAGSSRILFVDELP